MNNYVNTLYHEIYIEEVYSHDLDKIIKEKQNELLAKIKGENAKGSTYNISYKLNFYQNLATIQFTVYVYSGGAHDIRYDKIYYYDLNNGKFLELEDLITNETKFFKKISAISKEILKKEKKELIYEDAYLVEDGLKLTKENFQNIIFEATAIKIIFPPYQVGPWSSGEINVEIPYQDIADYLKI